jgi:hypothetical protein
MTRVAHGACKRSAARARQQRYAALMYNGNAVAACRCSNGNNSSQQCGVDADAQRGQGAARRR